MAPDTPGVFKTPGVSGLRAIIRPLGHKTRPGGPGRRCAAACITMCTVVPTMPADYGLRVEVKGEEQRRTRLVCAQTGSTGALPAPGAYTSRGMAWIHSRHARPISSCASRFGLSHPPAEQPADLGYHLADMLVLAAGQPAPLERQAQIQAQLAQSLFAKSRIAPC